MNRRWLVSFAAFLCTFGLAAVAFAAGKAGPAANNWGVGLGAGLAVALAALGGALGQAKTAAAFLEGVTRNPKSRGDVFVALILGLAFIETLVIFAWLVASSLVGKI